jgi:uncharacterized NAD-dependent epimerase/dehydratase family protein
MKSLPEGRAVVYSEGAFATPNGKTAHGLVRRTERYQVLSVVDSRHRGKDAGLVLDGRVSGTPIYGTIEEAVTAAVSKATPATHLVVGLAPDGGRLSPGSRQDVVRAIDMGLHVDAGLHDFLSEDDEIMALAEKKGATVRDVRKPPPRNALHFFCGKIEKVTSFKIAVLGTDSAIGKRTTAWILKDGFEAARYKAEMIGTGQTAWMQGARYSIILDSLINDFVSGEIEHAVWRAWDESRPDVIIIEGQGSLMNPAYPGGFEILAAGRPDAVVLQHAPARKDYDGFPGYPIHPLEKQIQAVQLLSGRPVAAVTINHEALDADDIPRHCREIEETTGLPAFDVLMNGADGLVETLKTFLRGRS